MIIMCLRYMIYILFLFLRFTGELHQGLSAVAVVWIKVAVNLNEFAVLISEQLKNYISYMYYYFIINENTHLG